MRQTTAFCYNIFATHKLHPFKNVVPNMEYRYKQDPLSVYATHISATFKRKNIHVLMSLIILFAIFTNKRVICTCTFYVTPEHIQNSFLKKHSVDHHQTKNKHFDVT